MVATPTHGVPTALRESHLQVGGFSPDMGVRRSPQWLVEMFMQLSGQLIKYETRALHVR
jgi:hypothetical protein